MALNRRQFLIGAGGLAAAATVGLAGCAPGSSLGGSQSGGDQGGTANLALTWWGNPTRNENTQKMIDAYVKVNPSVKITGQPGEFSSYWDKLATQTAGGNAPDIIQMELRYINEYASRGSLLDLAENGVDTSKFIEGTAEAGKINGTLVGLNAGINSVVIMANPKVFEKAKMDLPDDMTWTWDQMAEIAAEVASKAGVTFGMASLMDSDALFEAFVRQQGKELFTPDGLGFEASDAQAWYDLMIKFQKAKAIGSPAQITEESSKSLDQSAVVVGTGAMQKYWSNQLEAVSNAAGQEMKMLRFPSLAGNATERKAWYHASMLWSVSSTSKNPEAAAAWINWFANSPDAANIDLAERGTPPNAEILAEVTPKLSPAQQAAAQFITDIKPEVANTPIVPPPGGGTLAVVLGRFGTEVLFGRTSTAEAGQKFVDELTSNLQV